jgi:D-alanyl-lipoteichoic acid acyltransferase DltB (MBOAT superfamily)
MAIGIALLLGFEFPKNFDAPYKSKSITEFWRRWHISLSSWLKDYLYISLGGNRKGKVRQYINLLLTMLLGGLWHGASLNFILWGGLHGIFLCLDKIWKEICKFLSPLTFLGKNAEKPNWAIRTLLFPLSGFITFHLVAATWVLFRAPSMQIASDVFTQIFTMFDINILQQWTTSYGGVALLMALGYLLHFAPSRWQSNTRKSMEYLPVPILALALVFVIWIVIQVKSSEVQPFIYFQF